MDLDFKMLIKYLNQWKKYVKLKRLIKKQKAKDMANMMKAIHRHESRLVRRSMASLRFLSHKFHKLRVCGLRV